MKLTGPPVAAGSSRAFRASISVTFGREVDAQAGRDLLHGPAQRLDLVGEEADLAVAGLGADPQDHRGAGLQQVAGAAQQLGLDHHLVLPGRDRTG